MTRKQRAFKALIAAIFLAGGVLIPSLSRAEVNTGSIFTKDSDSSNRAFSDLATCISSKKMLNVLYLVDESGSIKETDPLGDRADILADSLKQLSKFRGTKHFAVVSFADSTQVRRNWQPITDDSVSSQSSWLRNTAGSWTTNGWTNWFAALSTVSSQFSIAPDTDTACKALIWVTDGGIGVSESGRDAYNQALTTQAITQICARNPSNGNTSGYSVIEALRRSQVSVFGVLFESKSYLAGMTEKARANELSRMSYMKAVVEGSGIVDATAFGGPTKLQFNCPSGSISKKEPAGALLRASDPLALAYQFAKIPVGAKNGTESKVSSGTPNKFTIEPGVAAFDLLVPSPTWTLKDPSGRVVATQSGGSDETTSVARGQVATVSVDVSGDGQGQWTLVRAKTSQPTALYLYSGLDINLEKSDFVAGKEAKLRGQIVSAKADNAVDLNQYGQSKLNVKSINVDTGDGTPVVLDMQADGKFGGEFTPEKNLAVATFDVSLQLTTKSGLKLRPITKRFVQSVKLPQQFPSVSWSKFTPLNRKHGTADATVTIIGSKGSPGKVCFENPRIIQDPNPARLDSFTFNGSVVQSAKNNKCFDIAAGTSRTENISIGNETPADGLIQGEIPATFKSALSNGDDIHQVSQFTIKSQIIPGNPLPAILLATLAGILFALALFYFMSWRSSRLSLAGITVARIKVKITLGDPISKLVRADGRAGALLSSQGIDGGDFKPIPVDLERVRQWNPPGGSETIVAIFPLNPFGRMAARINVSPGFYAIGQSVPTYDAGKRQAGIELNPSNSFYLVIAESALRKSSASLVASLATGSEESNPFGAESAQFVSHGDRSVELGDEVEVELVAIVSRGTDKAIESLNQTIDRSNLFTAIVTLANEVASKSNPPPDSGKSSRGKKQESSADSSASVAAVAPTFTTVSDPNNPFGNTAPQAPAVSGPENPFDPKNPFLS